ncbi:MULTISPECIES: glycosyltransferase [Acutalibacteraceae]|uniref:glycosyltransferase n=1 Tax=Acutalibacteraceae TaxID=3082771 RepID=UPI00196BAFC8|nr:MULTISPECIES: glycosyltransferase [Acutalibacteraceae]
MNGMIDDRHVFRMTDDTGMFQHAVCGVPDPTEGYTLDDNARALIMAALLYQRSPEKKYEDLLYRYTSFLLYAQKRGWFRNFMGYDRRFLEKRGSEDSFGRCICSLGYAAACAELPDSIGQTAKKLLLKTYQSCSSLSFLKGKAYALTGLLLWGDPAGLPGTEMLTESIVDTYAQCRREDWRWFEEQMTYCSGILPLSLLFAYQRTRRKQTLRVALESLDFLLSVTIRDGIFRPIGCKGWYPKGGTPAEFDGQPVEACCTMMACLAAHRLTGSIKYRDSAANCYRWYLGDNSLRLPMIDPETGGCRDGLTKNGVNRNEGAESIVCWLIAALMAEREKLTEESSEEPYSKQAKLITE